MYKVIEMNSWKELCRNWKYKANH